MDHSVEGEKIRKSMCFVQIDLFRDVFSGNFTFVMHVVFLLYPPPPPPKYMLYMWVGGGGGFGCLADQYRYPRTLCMDR